MFSSVTHTYLILVGLGFTPGLIIRHGLILRLIFTIYSIHTCIGIVVDIETPLRLDWTETENNPIYLTLGFSQRLRVRLTLRLRLD